MTSTLLSDYVPTGELPVVQAAVPVVPAPRMSPTQVYEWDLVARVQAGETAAFAALYERYLDPVFRYLYFRVGNRQVAEDLASETFLRALRRIGSVSFQGRDLGAWLVTIARHLLVDHFKSGRYKYEVVLGDVSAAATERNAVEAGAQDEVLDQLMGVQLWAAVARLKEGQRECLTLRFVDGLSVAQTAAVMGREEGAIKALQYRAVRALAKLLPPGFATGEES